MSTVGRTEEDTPEVPSAIVVIGQAFVSAPSAPYVAEGVVLEEVAPKEGLAPLRIRMASQGTSLAPDG